MPRELLTRSARRVAVVSAVSVAVIAAAVLLTIWRYETAVSKWDAAQDEETDAGSATALIGIFWHEREAMNEYLLVPSPAVLAEIRAQQPLFTRVAAIVTPETPQEVSLPAAGSEGKPGPAVRFHSAPGRCWHDLCP